MRNDTSATVERMEFHSGRGLAQLRENIADAEHDRDVIGSYLERLRHANIPGVAAFEGFEGAKILWQTPSSEPLEPLSSHAAPFPAETVHRIAERLAGVLARMHEDDLSAYDLAPDRILATEDGGTVVLAPAPWVAELARRGRAPVSETIGLAPELEADSPNGHRPQSDIYAFGALIHFLLTGRRFERGDLPSSIDTALQPWDVLVDGCTRTSVRRRFESVAAAAADKLPAAKDLSVRRQGAKPEGPRGVGRGTQDKGPSDGGQTRPFGRIAVVAGLAVLVVAVSVVFFLIGGGGSKRGFADTIIRYEDRSYENTKWQEVKAASALTTMARLDSWNRIADFHTVHGHDDENLWIADKHGRVFGMQEGHWRYLGQPKQSWNPSLRAVDKSTLLISGDRHFTVAKQGSFNTKPHGAGHVWWTSIAIVDEDYHVIAPNRPGLGDRLLTNIAGRVEQVLPDRDKAWFLHDESNAPLNKYPAHWVRFSWSFERGVTYGMWVSHSHYVKAEPVLVRFDHNVWIEEDRMTRNDVINLNAGWMGEDDQGRFVVVVRDEGGVFLHRLGQDTLDHSIAKSEATTSMKLIAVWGVSAEKYWVVDASGTVWERDGPSWSTVVRGLYDKNILFNDAWVGETGIVYAVSKDKLYRLQ